MDMIRYVFLLFNDLSCHHRSSRFLFFIKTNLYLFRINKNSVRNDIYHLYQIHTLYLAKST